MPESSTANDTADIKIDLDQFDSNPVEVFDKIDALEAEIDRLRSGYRYPLDQLSYQSDFCDESAETQEAVVRVHREMTQQVDLSEALLQFTDANSGAATRYLALENSLSPRPIQP